MYVEEVCLCGGSGERGREGWSGCGGSMVGGSMEGGRGCVCVQTGSISGAAIIIECF